MQRNKINRLNKNNLIHIFKQPHNKMKTVIIICFTIAPFIFSCKKEKLIAPQQFGVWNKVYQVDGERNCNGYKYGYYCERDSSYQSETNSGSALIKSSVFYLFTDSIYYKGQNFTLQNTDSTFTWK